MTRDNSPPALPTMEAMKLARRWLLSNARKVPFYVDGSHRSGTLDSPEDVLRLGTFDQAVAARALKGDGWNLGFALGADGTGNVWQGIDLDKIAKNCLSDLANNLPGYVEVSIGGEGAHAMGYGRLFATLGSNGSGIEAYSSGRYFIVTSRPIRDGGLTCLAEYVERQLAPHHDTAHATGAADAAPPMRVSPQTVTDLRSALAYLHADDRDGWVRAGMALKELGDTGRGLWLDWSQTSEKYDPRDACRKWESFKPHSIGYQTIFAEAQRMGWVNPSSNAARLPSASGRPEATARHLVGRSLDHVVMRAIEWLWEGWIPLGYLTILAGETGAGKSTVLADVAARVSTGDPWPGESADRRRLPGRVLWLGSEDSVEEMTVPRLTACGADLANILEITGARVGGSIATFSLQDDLEEVERWLTSARGENRPFHMLVIDPVTSYLPGQRLRKVDLNDAGQLRNVLEPWLRFAGEQNIAIVCVTHFSKDTSRSMLNRVLGSAAFAQTCRSLCAVVQQPATEEGTVDPHAKILMQVKGNLPEHPGGAWRFTTEKVEIGVDPRNGKPIVATRPDWGELDAMLNPETVVGKSRGPVSNKPNAFGLWLKTYFAHFGPEDWVDIETVLAAAVSVNKIVSQSWWNKHSGEFLHKRNDGGKWLCRPKNAPSETS